MYNSSDIPSLRYGFDLDHSGFVDIGMHSQLIMSLVNTFVVQPFPLFVLIRKSRSMSASIRRGYIAMHLIYITYEIIFFFLARIYVTLPWPGLYCEGPLCQLGLPNGAVLGFISFSIVLIQPPFAFLIIRMHQMLIAPDSRLRLSKRVQASMASVQLTLMALNVVGFVIFGKEPDNFELLLKEPELAILAARGGQLLLFGTPGDSQYFRSELIFFFITLAINFPVLVFFMGHSMLRLKQTSQAAKSSQTQRLTNTMFEVFVWQLNCITVSHVIPLMGLFCFMTFDARKMPNLLLALCKLLLLISFTLNSTQFCAIFILKNASHRQLLFRYLLTMLRFVTKSKSTPVQSTSSTQREVTLSMTIV